MRKLPENLRFKSRKRGCPCLLDQGLHDDASTIPRWLSGSSEQPTAQLIRGPVRTCNGTIAKAKSPGIIDLPAELFDAFYDLLDLVSIIRLRQTCRALYYHGSDIHRLMRSLSVAKDPKSRFARLCFAERSYTKSPCDIGMPLCGGCQTYHSEGAFSDKDKKKQPEERLCFGQTGRLYFSPEHSVSFRELEMHSSAPAFVRSLATDIKKESQYGWRPIDNTHRLTPYLVSPIYQQCNPIYGHRFDYFWRFDICGDAGDEGTAQSLKEKLGARAIKLCPHIRSDDPMMIDAIHKCRRKHIYIHKNASKVSCQKCQMHACVMLRAVDPWSNNHESQHRVIVHIARYIGQIARSSEYRHWFSARCECGDDVRKAMQPQWVFQLDQPRLRAHYRFTKENIPLMNPRPELARRYRLWFRHFDNDVELEWGACGHW
ncbi:MAG: hypothetical protein Q9191_006335 [Dirinaria sp. TL-2023a]